MCCFLSIDLIQVNCVGRSHLSVSLGQVDECLQLSWSGGELTSSLANFIQGFENLVFGQFSLHDWFLLSDGHTGDRSFIPSNKLHTKVTYTPTTATTAPPSTAPVPTPALTYNRTATTASSSSSTLTASTQHSSPTPSSSGTRLKATDFTTKQSTAHSSPTPPTSGAQPPATTTP